MTATQFTHEEKQELANKIHELIKKLNLAVKQALEASLDIQFFAHTPASSIPELAARVTETFTFDNSQQERQPAKPKEEPK